MSKIFKRLHRAVAVVVSATIAAAVAVVAAPAAHADGVPSEVNIRLSAEDKAHMTDKSYWWTNEPASVSWVKFVEAGAELVLHYTVTDTNGAAVPGATLTLNAGGNATFTGSLTETTDADGAATFTLRNTVDNATAEPRPVPPSTMDYWDDSRGGFAEIKFDLNPTIGAATEHVDRVWTHTVKTADAPAVKEANLYLSASNTASMTNKSYWWTNEAASRSWVKFVEAGSTLSLTYCATTTSGDAIANQDMTLKTGAINRASFTGTLTATTDANGCATFSLQNTTSNDNAEPRPVAPSTMDYWDDSRGATLGGIESTYNFEPTIGYDIEHVDRVWTHTVKAEVQDLPLPSHVNIRLISPSMDLGSNAYDATDWIRPYIDANSKVFLTYLDAGSTTSFTYKATDADTGAAVANKSISLVVNANWSCSNATFEVNGVTAGPDWCNGDGQTKVSGTTDANGEVTFSVKSTNTTDEAEARPSAFNQPSDKWGAGERKSNIQITMGATRESIDILFGHIIKPVPAPTPLPAEVNIRVSDADKASMADKSYWWTNEPASRSLVKFITAGDDFSVTYKVTDTAGNAVANVNLTLKCLGGTASFSGCTDGKIVKVTNSAGEATFTVKSTTPDAAAEPRPVAPSSMNYWDDSRTVPAESNYNFEPTVGAPIEHIDRIWTHTVKAAAAAIPVANIYLTDASKVGMTDKSYWWTNEAASHSLVKFVVAGGTLVLTYRATDANGAALSGKAVTLNSAAGGGCFTGNFSGTTNSDGYVTFTLTNCTAPASAEPYPTAPSNIGYWDDSRVVSPEVKYDFWPTLGASVEHIDRVWTHTVRAEELTIRLSDADTASMTDKSYWWTNEPDSHSWVKFVTAGDTLTLTYRVTDANGAVAGRTVTLNAAAGGGCFTGSLTGTTNSSGYVTFSLKNCTADADAEPRPVSPSSMDYWDDSRTVENEVKYDFSPTAGAGVEHIDRVWTHTVKAPSKPDAISAIYVTPGDGSIDVSFDAPFDGGSAITGYSVTAKFYTGTNKVNTVKKFTLGADETFFTFDKVGNGLTYSFAITATNAKGTSASTESPKVTPGTAAAPTIDNITAANGKLTLEFTPGDSGMAATRYYQYSLNGGATWVTNRKFTSNTFTISKLRNGETYSVKVRAVNRFGAGQASEGYDAAPIADAPSAPRVSKTSTTSSSITVYFKAGYNGGADITDYEYSVDGGDSWTSAGTTSSPVTIEGLDPLTTYAVTLRAINSTGEGTASTVRNVKTRR